MHYALCTVKDYALCTMNYTKLVNLMTNLSILSEFSYNFCNFADHLFDGMIIVRK